VTANVIRPLPARAGSGSMNSVACSSTSQRISSPTRVSGSRPKKGVEGDGDAGVAEAFLDVLWVLAFHGVYCSAAVAEIVEPNGW